MNGNHHFTKPTGLDFTGKKGVAIAPNVGHTIVVSTIGLDLMMTGRRNTILRYLGSRVWDGQIVSDSLRIKVSGYVCLTN